MGKTTITVTQAADLNYSAREKIFTITVNQAPQTLSFDANNNPASCTYGQACQVKARSSSTSRLPISYHVEASTAEKCDVDTATGRVTYKRAGECRIHATQAGDNTYQNGSTTEPHTITMQKAITTLYFPYAGISFEHNADFFGGVTVLGLNGRAHRLVKYRSSNPDICKVKRESDDDTGWVSRPGNAGESTTITATIEEDDYYLKGEASYVCRIHQASQTLTFDASNPTSCTYGQPCQVIARSSSNSGLAIHYRVDASTNNTCEVSDSRGVVTYRQAGECKIHATQEGNHNYHRGATIQAHTIMMQPHP